MNQTRLLNALAYIRDYYAAGESKHPDFATLERAIDSGEVTPSALSDVKDVLFALRNDDVDHALRGMQKEGWWFNDAQASMRDLYAAIRGTGYDGEDVGNKQNKLFAAIQNVVEPRRRIREETVHTLSERATELRKIDDKTCAYRDAYGDWYALPKSTYADLVLALKAEGAIRSAVREDGEIEHYTVINPLGGRDEDSGD